MPLMCSSACPAAAALSSEQHSNEPAAHHSQRSVCWDGAGPGGGHRADGMPRQEGRQGSGGCPHLSGRHHRRERRPGLRVRKGATSSPHLPRFTPATAARCTYSLKCSHPNMHMQHVPAFLLVIPATGDVNIYMVLFRGKGSRVQL